MPLDRCILGLRATQPYWEGIKMSEVLARSNKRTEVLFVTATTTHTDKINGGGFGAYCKMIDRATMALLGVPSIKCNMQFNSATSCGAFTNRKTGEQVVFEYLEVM